MEDRPLTMSLLYDFYGGLLTPKQREFFEYRHGDDLSLSEIAENAGISRQGVRDILIRGEGTLLQAEEKIGAVRRFSLLQRELDQLSREAGELAAAADPAVGERLAELAARLAALRQTL